MSGSSPGVSVSSEVSQVSERSPLTELTPVAWITNAELGLDEWMRYGSRLGMAGRGAAWWIGDWVRYGTARFGNKYGAAARITGYDRQTLMNMVYVVTRFETSRRREGLSWSHHAELAALDHDRQELWLDRAAAERFSVRDLREALQAVREVDAHESASQVSIESKQAGDTGRERASEITLAEQHTKSAAIAELRAIVCPSCGHSFTVSA